MGVFIFLKNILGMSSSKKPNSVDCIRGDALDLSLVGDKFAEHAQESLNIKIRNASERSLAKSKGDI